MKRENNNQKIIIVTGASGFIGSAVVKVLNDQGYNNLLLVDDLKNEKWKNLVHKNFIDIIYKEELFEYLKGKEKEIDAIIHLGACSSTICRDENYLFENNYRYTKRLAEYAIKNNIRFIYASSAATYGNGENGFEDDEDNLNILKPINMYAYSKHLFDLYAKKMGYLDKIVGLKYFNVFGPNEYHKGPMASMILKMLSKITKEGSIELFKSNDYKNYKDGEQKRDFIYVKDAAYMTTLFLQNKVCGIFNIGSGKAVSWNDLAAALFNAVNKKIKINYIDMPIELNNQYQNFTQADMTKYKNAFKNFKTADVLDAVKDYVQNYLIYDKRW
jgi:ADP-L-glycero-D-manno-heptose 6-epimerase